MMPLVRSSYIAPRLLRNGHLQTIYGGRLRAVAPVAYRRERIDTPDGDFLHLDWHRAGSDRLAILSHGLEGDTERVYIRGMATALLRAGWDVLAWNYRGCGGVPNRLLRAYHSGATDDLDVVVRHALPGYDKAALVGFSLGGNLTLKYVGERGDTLDARIRRAIAFSTPCDLDSGARELEKPSNRLYSWYFLRTLRAKALEKARRFPGGFDLPRVLGTRTIYDFDDAFTAPIHGFRDSADYYRRCSCRFFIEGITIPTLLVNAADDPFLPEACYPREEARHHPLFHLEVPDHGGHAGFVRFGEDGTYGSEARAVAFLGD